MHLQDVKMVCWHPKGEVLVSCSYDDSIKVWVEDDGEWECAQTLAGPGLGHSSTVWGVSFDASGQRMVSCSDDLTLKIWACHFDNPGNSHSFAEVHPGLVLPDAVMTPQAQAETAQS